ncbi:MAG: hypothetical protein ABIF11_07005 [Nitrospirota bacterium]
MVDYAELLLSGKPKGPVKKKPDKPSIDYAEMLLSGKTEELRQGKTTGPRFEFGKEQNPASWFTHAKAAWAEEPMSKIKVYAKARGISSDRYMIKDGKISYLGDDGYFYNEEASLPSRITSEMAARPLSTAGAVAGAVAGGPALSGLLAAGGRGIEKTIGSLAFDEYPETVDTLTDLGKEFILATLGEGAGRGIIRGIDVSRGKEAAKLIRMAGRGRERISTTEMKEMEKLSKEFVIDLFTPQLTGSRELAARWNLLADLMETADKMGVAVKKQYEQTAGAISKYLEHFGPETVTPSGAGTKIATAAEKGIQAAKTARRNATQKLYDEALKVEGVDISTSISKIDEMMGDAVKGTPEYSSLNKLKTMLTKAKVETTYDEWGKKITKTIKVPEDRLLKIDKVKKQINSMWKKDPKNAPAAQEKYSINKLLDDMLESVDEQVPVYAEARKRFTELSPPINKLKEGKLGELSKLEYDAVEKAAFKTFSPTQSSPEIINAIKPILIKHGGQESWDNLLKVHFTNILDGVKDNITGTTNLGGRFRQALYGYPKQRKILEASMTPEQFGTLERFGKLLDRLGVVLIKESRTAPAGEAMSAMKKEAGKGVWITPLRVIAHPLVSPARPVYEKIVDMRFLYNAEKMADIMLDPRAARDLHKILSLKPNTSKFIKASTQFLSQVGGKMYFETSNVADYIPEKMGEMQTQKRAKAISK